MPRRERPPVRQDRGSFSSEANRYGWAIPSSSPSQQADLRALAVALATRVDDPAQDEMRIVLAAPVQPGLSGQIDAAA